MPTLPLYSIREPVARILAAACAIVILIAVGVAVALMPGR